MNSSIRRISIWTCEGIVCAVRVSRPIRASELGNGTLSLEALAGEGTAWRLHGRWISAVWDFIAQLSVQLADDMAALAPLIQTSSLMHDTLGPHPLIVEDGATIESYVVFDTTEWADPDSRRWHDDLRLHTDRWPMLHRRRCYDRG